MLPPLAAALFAAAGRHPLAGLAAAFAGVAGGFGAGFFPTGGDGALAGFAQDAAHVVDPDYSVNILHNLYFKALSAIVVMLAGGSSPTASSNRGFGGRRATQTGPKPSTRRR